MINTNRCTLCQPISLDAIAADGITLPLEPYLTAWRTVMESEKPCGLCVLLYRSLPLRVYKGMDTLLLEHNAYVGAIVIAATTKGFLQTSILPKLLCGEHGEKWLFHAWGDISEFAPAFLSINLGVGM